MRPFLKWAGSKKWLVRKGVPVPKRGYFRYVEPFLGSGAVFFDQQPSHALLSDTNSYLVNCFVQLRDNWHSVYQRYFDLFSSHSEGSYYQVRRDLRDEGALGAAQFLYLNRTCFNGIFRVNLSGRFNVPIGSKISNPFVEDDFKDWSTALTGTEVLHQDFEETINRTGIGDFVFVDPPYTASHNKNGFIEYNEKIFSWQDQIRLADTIKNARNRGAAIVLTNADHSSVRELYSDEFLIAEIDRRSAIAGDTSKRRLISELLISSF